MSTGELWKDKEPIKLSPKPARVLGLLASSPGELISREQFREALWGADTFVDFEHGLNFCIREVRAALEDDAKNPRFIQTLARRGYRFIGQTSLDRGPLTSGGGSTPETIKIQAYEHYSKAREAFVQHGAGSLERAREEFEKALALDPDYAMAHSGLGATFSLRSLNRRDPADFDAALTHLKRALVLDPELAEPYPWLCYVHMRRAETERALEAGHRAVLLQPDLAHAHYFLGLAYFVSCEEGAENYQRAADHLMNAGRVGPLWHPTWFVLAYVALLNGAYARAEEFANRLVQKRDQPGLPFVGAEIVLASVQLRQSQYAAARSILVEFLERMTITAHFYRDSMMAAAACGLGDVELRAGNYAEALSAYRRGWHTVQEHPRIAAHHRISARSQAGLASAYLALGETDRGLGLLEKAVRMTNECSSISYGAAGASLPELYLSLAGALVRGGDCEQAFAFLDRAVNSGWRDANWLSHDPELRVLREDPRFAGLMKIIQKVPSVTFNGDNRKNDSANRGG